MQKNSIDTDLSRNEEYLKNTIGKSSDIFYRYLTIPALDDCESLIVYIGNLVKSDLLESFVIEPLKSVIKLTPKKTSVIKNDKMEQLIDAEIIVLDTGQANEWTSICDAILSGDTVLFLEKSSTALIIVTKGWKSRSITEPVTESEVRGPRDGFIENVNINIALIRRRIKDYGLRFENLKIGERTKTDVYLAYIDGLVNESNLQEVRKRLNKIKTDSVLASAYIEEFIEDAPYSVFPQIDNTERPDKACAAILEGRIVIMVDNTPAVLIVPTVFWEYFLAPGDYYERYFIASFVRWVRLLSMFLTLSMSSFYVLLTSFHQEMIPTPLALKIAAGREGVPFPAVLEALTMEIIFEIMKEAGIRMPKQIGPIISIVGTLVIGQAAVSAGIVGSALIIVIAIAAISSFAIPSYTMSNSLRLLRFPLLILSSTFGLTGYLVGVIAVSLHLMSLRSFGVPFLSPVFPFQRSGNKDIFIRAPWWKMMRRPWLSRAKDTNRQQPELKPKSGK